MKNKRGMKQQSVSFTKIAMLLVTLCAGGYAGVTEAQVYYPSTPEYHSALITNPIIEGSALPYATPVSPVQPPTIPPNAAFGLEHQSAYVIPSPRVITQQKMGIAPAVTAVAPGAPLVNAVSPESTLVAPSLGPTLTSVVPTVTTPAPMITPSSAPPVPFSPDNELLEQHPDAAYTRFFTTVPTTTYSDELPLIVSITS